MILFYICITIIPIVGICILASIPTKTTILGGGIITTTSLGNLQGK